MRKREWWVFLLAAFLNMACDRFHSQSSTVLFEALPAHRTGICFENSLTSTDDFNIYKYRNFYNGGGVGIGDVNNDGLLDLYFTANQEPNRLYLNRGDWRFEEVTQKAGVGGQRAWSTGISMVDINADGWMDLYVCNSGDVKGDNKQNEFFINNGPSADGSGVTFTDRAEEMGLDDRGFSTHAAFFDYDKDGDLDVYLLNNSYRSIGSFNLRENERPIRDELGGDKLYRNDNGLFIDVSEEAGIYGSEIGFGLGVAVSDLNKDGWMDLYISNDFFERDYLYLNNGDGTFSEQLEKQMRSISNASMGVDAADLSEDGYPEIFVNDMLPEPNDRFKTTMTFENWDKYQHSVNYGYYHQFTRNTLHLNQGVLPGKGLAFSEIGRLTGMEATDWSWTALLADLNNDSYRDVYITNGIYQDILNQDFIQYIASEKVARMVITEEGVNYKELIDLIPSNRIPNYVFAGGPELQFCKQTTNWGLDTPSHSNGAAYGDLDNDGDLDLVVNNVGMPAFVYRNNGTVGNYLTLILKGERKNLQAVGAQVTLKAGNRLFYSEQYPNRGFQSSVDTRVHIGLGNFENIDTLRVDWPYGKVTLLTGITSNQFLELEEREAIKVKRESVTNSPSTLFQENMDLSILPYRHWENNFSDFDYDRLLYHMKSTEGPRMAVADVNGDGREDCFIGGAKDMPGSLFLQQSNGRFQLASVEVFSQDQASEDVECLFFDADGDGDQDLYVASGGNEFSSASFALVDRLYFNDGQGQFSRSDQVLPTNKLVSSATVNAGDYDGDGDADLFVGVRLRSRQYGVPPDSYLLVNDGNGQFQDVTQQLAPGLKEIGMVTDAVWSDADSDGDLDLVVVGEWMGVKFFENRAGKLVDVSGEKLPAKTNGWWNTIVEADLDDDGRPDYLIGNHGLNSRFRATTDRPISCYVNDFDRNGTVEQIICQYNGERQYPTALRHDLLDQLPHLKKQLLKYEDYKDITIQDIFDPALLQQSVVHQVFRLESVVLWNQGEAGFWMEPLPQAAQLAPVYAFTVRDFDADGQLDILLGGNFHRVKPEVGAYDASYGAFLKGLGNRNFRAIAPRESGLILEDEVRDLEIVEIDGSPVLVVVRNNRPVQLFQLVRNPAI